MQYENNRIDPKRLQGAADLQNEKQKPGKRDLAEEQATEQESIDLSQPKRTSRRTSF